MEYTVATKNLQFCMKIAIEFLVLEWQEPNPMF